MENSKKIITRCLELIEEKLSRGKRSTWDANDFRVLSKSIKEVTGTLLSVSTLKRISGKANYGSKPNSTTLDALARYVGFEDWRAFLKDDNNIEIEEQSRTNKNSIRKYVIPFLLLVLALVSSFYIFLANSDKSDDAYFSKDFSFKAKSTTTSIPNSVIFEYDASEADENAIIEIQQDWDERKRVIVDKKDSVSTSIYYRPGFFKSKLVVDNKIVMEKNIFIPTQDWLGVIESDSLPVYLNEEDFKKNNNLQITSETLAQYGVDPSTKMTAVGFYQVKDFGNLYTDEFEMSSFLRNEYKSGVSVCQRVQVVIMHEDGPIMIVLSDKGCISEISLFAFGKQIDGKKTDLSDFGVDFSEYVELKCISENQKLNIFLDGKSVFTFDVPETRSKIIGITALFEGAGSLKSVEFRKNREVVYASEF